ncbi:Protein LAZ1-like 2 [Glycine soja]|uniref:Protein LAZ1-like 2 n=1 Tax=Glycine soja TaxID=3848 RepID=A0A445GUZ4_GLYSO|nr:Protein LAZ1-like 2 [Glycine soja]
MASNHFSNFEGTNKNLRPPALIIVGCSMLVALLGTASAKSKLVYIQEQKWIVVVISMVPIYATKSIISLWNPRLSLACDILRNYYEAFALYSFGRFLIACLGIGPVALEIKRFLETLLLLKSIAYIFDVKLTSMLSYHPKPLVKICCVNIFCNIFWHPYKLGKDLLTTEKFGLVQYMILKTVYALLAFILELAGVYGDGEFKWYYGYPYIAVVLNFSQMWALYYLVQFYNVTHERLQPIKPLAKFISFKAIVFATWWQGVGIAVLCTFGVLPNEGKFQTGLQDFLISIEMAIAAVAHVFVFSAKPYHFLLPAAYGKISKETIGAALEIDEGKSVQDIVVKGGQRVVKDVVLTINQAIGPVEKGVTKIQQTFHHKTVVSSSSSEEESNIQIEKDVTKS